MAGLVIGVGNPLRGDDGVGAAVARAVAHVERVWALAVTQLTPELGEALAAAPLAVIVDARVDLPPGSIHQERLTGTEARRHAAVLGHHLAPAQLVDLTRLAYGWVPPVFVVGVGACDFDRIGALSGPVAAAVPDAAAIVSALLSAPVASPGG